MTFLPITSYYELGPEGTAAADRQSLRQALVPYIGERAVSLFSYAISDENDSLVCSAYFRRVLVDNGEDPENPQVTEAEQLLIDWGRLVARDPGGITPEFYARLESTFTAPLRVLLLGYAGQIVAANIFTTVGRAPLDEELYAYRRPGDDRTE